MRGKNWEALAAVGRLLSFILGSFSAFISIFSGSSWHCCLEFQRAGLYSGALWLSSCPSSPPRLLRLLPGGGGALSGRVGDCYVRDGGVIALVRCSGLPGPAFVIPPPRPHLPGSVLRPLSTRASCSYDASKEVKNLPAAIPVQPW